MILSKGLGPAALCALLWWSTVLCLSSHAPLCNAQATATANLVEVSTIEELQQAFANITSHVLVRKHLNLVAAPKLPESKEELFLDNAVIRPRSFAKSLVGNCTGAGPAPPGFGLTDPLLPSACALFVREDFLNTEDKVTLWLSNIYVVVSPKAANNDAVVLFHTNGDLYITNTTFQGGGTNCRAVELSSGLGNSPRLWLEDVTITGFTRPDAPGVLLDNDTTINTRRVTIKDMRLTAGGIQDRRAGSALTVLNGAGAELVETKIVDNFVLGKEAGSKSVTKIGGADDAVIYALPPRMVWDWVEEVEEETLNVQQSRERGQGISSNSFLQVFQLTEIKQEQGNLVAQRFGIPPAGAEEPKAAAAPPATPGSAPGPPPQQPPPGATDVQEALGPISPPGAPQSTPGNVSTIDSSPGSPQGTVMSAGNDGSPSSGGQNQVGWTVGIAVGVALIIALCGVVALIFLLRRQRRRQQAEQIEQDGWAMHQEHSSWPESMPSADGAGGAAGGGTSAVTLASTSRNRSTSRSGSTSSNGVLSRPMPTGSTAYIHPTSSLSAASVNPAVGSIYPTYSAQSTRSGVTTEQLQPPPQKGMPAPEKLSRSDPSESAAPLKPPISSNSSMSGKASAPAGVVAMVSLAAKSSNPPPARGESISSMGIALPTSTRDISSVGVAHGSRTLGTTFDSIPVDPPALPLPTTADREAGSIMPSDLLEHALDNMSAAEVAFMGEFRLLGPMERRGGGQGLVQFAIQLRTNDPVAIKFFMNSRAFECERDLYSQVHLRGMMPAVSLMHSNTDGAVVTEEGWRFPPFIVVERGESLDEWQAHVKPDFATVVQVLSHICERVKTLHDAGVAHRDLKPGNVLWRPKHYSWTLIDFGCAAEIGAVSRLTFSVSYSPPETLMTLRNGQRTIKSDPAADIWAIGLIAYELIHRQRAFREFSWTFTDVLDAAAAAKAYPWEDRPGTFKRDPELRALGSVVRACLARDAAARPTASQLVQKLHRLFDSQGTTLGGGTHTSDAEPSVPMPEVGEAAKTESTHLEPAAAETGTEPPVSGPPVWEPRQAPDGRPPGAVRPPPGITPAVNTRTHTHSRIELNSLQPSSVLATTAEVRHDGTFDAGLRQALAHAWGPSARLATTLEGNEETAETATTEAAASGDGPDAAPIHVAAALLSSSAMVTTADTGGENSSADAGGGGATAASGNPRSPAECAVSGAGSSLAAGASGTNDEG